MVRFSSSAQGVDPIYADARFGSASAYASLIIQLPGCIVECYSCSAGTVHAPLPPSALLHTPFPPPPSPSRGHQVSPVPRGPSGQATHRAAVPPGLYRTTAKVKGLLRCPPSAMPSDQISFSMPAPPSRQCRMLGQRGWWSNDTPLSLPGSAVGGRLGEGELLDVDLLHVSSQTFTTSPAPLATYTFRGGAPTVSNRLF